VTTAEPDTSPAELAAGLVERVRGGDRAAEDEVAGSYRRRILLMMLSRTRDRAVAEDLTQETLIAVLRALRAGEVREPERLGAFVLGTARNVVNGHFRALGREPAVVPIAPSMSLVDPEREFEAAEQRARARRALETLEGDDRRLLQLTLVEGLKPGEIADRLGLSAELVRTRKSRALKRLVEGMRKVSRVTPPRPQS
jgi:RNA polymerase sigma-70 factor (ECF subfamily)